ncbi:unnamed protein product [Ascophyllum nodosum]
MDLLSNDNVDIPESRASPPELAEVVRELDRDTRHVCRPTLSPRLKEWASDPYYVPSYIRKWTTPEERNALIGACLEVDVNRSGEIPANSVEKVLSTVDSEGALSKSWTRRAKSSLPLEKTSTLLRDAEDTASFRSILDFVAERNHAVRSAFGGKRCIFDRLPLPTCCENVYCTAQLSKPSADAQGWRSENDLQQVALKIEFARHDRDGSGALDMKELPAILDEHGVDYDAGRLSRLLQIYDVDRSGALDFKEFSALLKDVHADKAVAKKRMLSYDLPQSILKEFSMEEIDEMRMAFGLFDESGDGVLDEEELEKVLREFGQEPTKDKIHEEMSRIDCDRSGEIDFQEFVLLMKKIRDGVVELDDNALGRAIMDSVTATRLSQELKILQSDPVFCVQSAKLTRSAPATLQARIMCPNGTPYEGQTLTLELVAPDGYPFLAPKARILERVFHLNLVLLLDGSTALRSILDKWTAAWNVGRLLRELLDLLREPDPSLLPHDLRRTPTSLPPEETDPSSPSQYGGRSEITQDASSKPGRSSSTPCGRAGTPSTRTKPHEMNWDLREKKRSHLLTARVAELWYDNRTLYEQTAKRISQGQMRLKNSNAQIPSL